MILVGDQPGQIVHETLSQKNPTHTHKSKAGGVAQVVEHLSSNPSTVKNKQQTNTHKKTELVLVNSSKSDFLLNFS
jgi:hypothetical protein